MQEIAGNTMNNSTLSRNQIRIGIVGLTGRGIIARHFHKPAGKSVVTAGMDTSDKAFAIFKREINKDAYLTKNIDDLLSRDIDAVVITSPDFTHAEYAIKALQAGKHVYCDKPMGITIAQCDEMLEAWQKFGKHFMVGFNMRYMNIFRVMKDIVDSGDIGEVKAVWVRHFVGPGGNWYYHDWHGARKNSTSLLLQKASHDIDMIHWITGQYTKRVSAMGSLDYYGGDKPNDLRCPDCPDKDTCVEYQHIGDSLRSNQMDMCVFRKEVDVEDNSAVMMELANGIKATYQQCHYTPDYWRNYVFIGTEGRLENLDDNCRVAVKLRQRSKRWKNLAADRVYNIRQAEGGHGGADPIICNDFLELLLTGKRPVSTPLAGRMSVAVGCKATESMRNKSRALDIPELPASIRDKVY